MAPDALVRSSATDHTLLDRYRQGDDDAATQLYLRYAERLRSLAQQQTSSALKQRVDADDMVQSVFRTFFRRAAGGQYSLPEGNELWKLLLVIGLNKIRCAGNHHRAAKRNIARTLGSQELERPQWDNASTDCNELHLLQLTIHELLTPLPEFVRQIVELRIAGHEINEISAMSGRSKRSVERILQQFRNQLGEILNADL